MGQIMKFEDGDGKLQGIRGRKQIKARRRRRCTVNKGVVLGENELVEVLVREEGVNRKKGKVWN